MKELKFTLENYRRHFYNVPRTIWTTRDKLLDVSEPVVIISPSPLKREIVFRIRSVVSYTDIILLAQHYWELEGFRCAAEFLEELNHIYPSADILYVYELVEEPPMIGARCFDCKHFSESVLHTSITDNDFWNYCTLRKTSTKRHYSCSSFTKEDEE